MPHRRLSRAIARMKARGAAVFDLVEEEPEHDKTTDQLQDLSLCDPRSDAIREDDVEEEEQYVKAMLARSLDIFRRVKTSGTTTYREGWTLLEKELVLEMEYTNWAVLSDNTITVLCAYLLDLLMCIEKEFVVEEEEEEEAKAAAGGAAAATGPVVKKVPGLGKLREGAPPESLDCAFAALDVLEKMMEARFINFEGEDLERPFDREGSLCIYRALVSALRLIVATINYEGYDPAPPTPVSSSKEQQQQQQQQKEKEEEGWEREKGPRKAVGSSTSTNTSSSSSSSSSSNSRRPPTVPTTNSNSSNSNSGSSSSTGNGLGKTFTRPASLSSSALSMSGTHPSLSSPRNALAPKTFTFDDEAGKAQIHTKSKTYEPLQYLLTAFYLLSHTSVQTDATAFWYSADVVIEELWAPRNLQALLACIGIVLDKLHHSPDAQDQALLTILVDRWVHTLHGLVCADSIGRQMSATVPEEDKARDYENDKPGIECLTGVSTYLGRWMDVRCLPCSCLFCGVQRESMECMMSKWDRRLAHRLINLGGVAVIGRVAFWLLESFRSIEVSGDSTGEDLYRTDVALATQVVHLCILSDYQVATLAEAPTLRAQAVKQAIDSGFLNFLLAYFIPRKLCRLEDRQCETAEDQNKARRLARISCKNCIEFLLLSGDGWITDTCYNARGVVKIESGINSRMAPAAQRLVELWAEDKRVCGTTDELLEHYSPFFLKLCEIIRLSARYGCMKEHWSQELLDACVNVLATYTYLSVSHYSSSPSSPIPTSSSSSSLSSPSSTSALPPSLPPKKALLCAMATFTDMCSPFFGGRDHYSSASRAVHDCEYLKRVLDTAKSSKAATSCIRALSYVSRVELVVSVSTKKSCSSRLYHTHDGLHLHHEHGHSPQKQQQHQQHHQHQHQQQQQMLMMVCHQCHRPPTLDRPLRQCGRCKRVFYCCVECQRANWREHEKGCVPPEGQGGGEGGGEKRVFVKRGGGVGNSSEGEVVTEGEGEGGGAGARGSESGNGGSSATAGVKLGGVGGEGGGGMATGSGGGGGAGAGAGAGVGAGAGAAACCAQCEAKAQNDRQLMTCGRCREAFYCSKECQTKHWILHRRQCGPDPLLMVVEGGGEEERQRQQQLQQQQQQEVEQQQQQQVQGVTGGN